MFVLFIITFYYLIIFIASNVICKLLSTVASTTRLPRVNSKERSYH